MQTHCRAQEDFQVGQHEPAFSRLHQIGQEKTQSAAQCLQLHSRHCSCSSILMLSKHVVIFYCGYQITPATEQGPAELCWTEPETKDHPVPTDLNPNTIPDVTTAHKEAIFEDVILYPETNFIIWCTWMFTFTYLPFIVPHPHPSSISEVSFWHHTGFVAVSKPDYKSLLAALVEVFHCLSDSGIVYLAVESRLLKPEHETKALHILQEECACPHARCMLEWGQFYPDLRTELVSHNRNEF